jgi:beta-glucosidase-like glycosyl hydrolase
MKISNIFEWANTNSFVDFRDKELAWRIGEATALEVRASGIQWTFAPCVAVSNGPCLYLSN